MPTPSPESDLQAARTLRERFARWLDGRCYCRRPRHWAWGVCIKCGRYA